MAHASIGPNSKSLWTLDPRTLPGCVLWLDANDPNALVLSGSNVTTWNDKSRFGFNMTATAGTGSVVYSSNGFNGLPTVRFADNGRFCNAMQRYLFNSNVTAAVVFQKIGLDTTTTYADSLIGRYFSESAPIFTADTSSGNVRIIGNGTTRRTIDASGAFSLRSPQPNIYIFQTGSDLSWNEFYNGTQLVLGAATDTGTAAYSDASAGFLTIGGFGTAPRRTFNGLISEVILFNTRLDRFDRQRLEGYLANKWNMVYALPSNHPFGTAFLKNVIASPSAIPTCSAWFDATNTASLTLSGGTVTEWRDRVGNFHLTTSGTGSPTYISNAGEQSIQFNGTTNHLNISSGASLVVNTSFTIFVVENRTSSANNNYFLGGSSTGTNSNLVAGYNTSTFFLLAFFNNDLASNVPAFSASTEKSQIWSFTYTAGAGGGRQIHSNGTLLRSDAVTSNLLAWPNPAVGRFQAGPAFYSGKLRDIIFYKSALTTTQRQQVEDYLGYKYGFYSNSTNLAQFRSTNPTFVRRTLPLDISGCIGWYDADDLTSITLSGATTDVSGWRNKAQFNSEDLTNYGTLLPKYSLDASTGYFGVYFDNSAAFMGTNVSSSCVSNTYFAVARVRTVPTIQDTFSTLFSLRDAYGGDASVRYRSQDAFWDTSFDYNSNMLWAPENNGSLYVNGVGPLPPAGRSAPVTNMNILSVLSDVAGTSRLALSTAFGNRGMNDTYVYELLRYNRYLGSNERQRIEGYLANKWRLTSNVTANQPYSQYYGNKFLPTDIATCRAWYDAGDSATLSLSGSTVLTWRNKTTFAHDLSATERFQRYVSNQYVDFNVSGGLFIANASGLVANTSFTIVVLEQLTTSGGIVAAGAGFNSNYFMGGVGVVANSNLAFGHRNSNTLRLGFWNNDIDASTAVFDASAEPFTLWTARYDGTQRQIYSNGTLMTTSLSTQNLLNWTDAYIGRFPQGNNYYIGRLREIIFFRSGLTSNELSNVWSYLAWKWNLQWRLPTSSTISNIVPPNNEPFSPLQISNLAMWLDGTDISGNGLATADGASITQWNDKSGSARNATGGTAPTYSATDQAVLFNGNNSVLNSVYNPKLRNETLFVTVKNPNITITGGNQNLVAPNTTGGRQLIINSNGYIQVNDANITASISGGVVVNNTTTMITYVSLSNGLDNTLTLYQDGSSIAQRTAANWGGTSTTTNIGRFTTAASTLSGYMYEVIGFSNTLQLSEIQKVEGYLAWKWKLWSNLPRNHPYYETPP